MRRMTIVSVALATVTLAGCGSARPASSSAPLLIYVSAPISSEPWIASSVVNGAELAAKQFNAAGDVAVNGRRVRLDLSIQDNGGSPQTAVAIARQAVAAHAAAIVTDGVGAQAVAAVTDPANLPVFVTFEGGAELVNPVTQPTIFRIAPSDVNMAFRLCDYLAGTFFGTKPKVAFIADNSEYGQDGASAITARLRLDDLPLVYSATVPPSAADLSPQVLAARQAHATLLIVWADAADVADALTDARQSGWNVPVYTGPTGEDPLVRQRLAAHESWVSGMTFVSGRITSEIGPAPFTAFRKAYDAVFGPGSIGVQQGGRPVEQPPDWAQYSYDAVKLVAAAYSHAGAIGAPTMAQLNAGVSIIGANGDERGFGPTVREGVSPDDTYFATFHGFIFLPVTNDILSTGLPSVPQLGP